MTRGPHDQKTIGPGRHCRNLGADVYARFSQLIEHFLISVMFLMLSKCGKLRTLLVLECLKCSKLQRLLLLERVKCSKLQHLLVLECFKCCRLQHLLVWQHFFQTLQVYRISKGPCDPGTTGPQDQKTTGPRDQGNTRTEPRLCQKKPDPHSASSQKTLPH